MRIWLLTLIIFLGGCGSEQASKSGQTEAAPFPADDLTTLLNGVKLEVPKTGSFLWNGQDISRETLQTYLREAEERGRIVVQFEPGTPDARVSWVRQQVIAQGYCKQARCAEAPWKAVRPVVN